VRNEMAQSGPSRRAEEEGNDMISATLAQRIQTDPTFAKYR